MNADIPDIPPTASNKDEDVFGYTMAFFSVEKTV